jgi:hypothetical protein
MIGNNLIYRLEQDVFADISENSEYRLVKFDHEKVSSVTLVRVQGDFKAHSVAVWRDFFILASHS